ncbi:MauE/DoxX family redox-associated membrane protein [Actinophytocola oryzae]|uniref:MauE/DoxX family redox-associated membrane protein n=1 Tax=Actinophytocola oryzae TaxID=502181 RepID=UPI001AAFDDF0|nr:MauE/DoxX family redox-associated membrane protein [Actinophytocola oryzae]
MIELLASTQQAVVGGVLLWASWFKLLHRNASAAARRSVLARLVGRDRAPAAYRVVGVVEAAVGLLLIAPPAHPAEAVAAAALSVGMLGYLAYGKLRAPESSCGCLGDKQTPVRGRAFARAALLLVLSAFAATASTPWLERPLATIGLVVVEAALVVALSPELDRRWLIPLRRWRVRRSHPLATRSVEVPLESTVQQLTKSEAYRSVVTQLTSDLMDHWDEGEWRILTYSARIPSGPVTAVFAVPRLAYEPDRVRLALVPTDEEVFV